MLTYIKEDKILFTCDLFGSHLAASEVFVLDQCKAYGSAKRYYAEIMMPFRTNIVRHLEKLKSYAIDVIAPSHGPVYDDPPFILDAYRDWVSDEVKNEVVIAYVSMHGTTRRMVDHLTEALIKKGLVVKPFNLTRTDLGELAAALVDAATLVIASPTVLTGPHPAAVYAAFLANALRPKLKFVSVIGSFGWGGRTLEILSSMITNLKVEVIDPVIIKGYPGEENFQALDALAAAISEKHKGIIK